MVQSKQELRDLFSEAQIEPNPTLGQNFLIDQNLMRLLVDKANLQPNDTVLEVGAGTGSLTELLAEHCGGVVAVEIDRNLAKIAQKKLSDKPNVELFCQNVFFESKLEMGLAIKLTDNLSRLGGRLLLVANLPYSLASPLLIECICGSLSFGQMYFTVQREVADRILSTHGRKSYGLLSVIFQAAGRVKRLRNLPPSVFWPEPAVDSTMLSWIRATEESAQVFTDATALGSNTPLSIDDLLTVREIARVFLRHRRKKISSCINLKQESSLTVSDLRRAMELTSTDPNLRGEQLPVPHYIALAQAVNSR